MSLTCTHLVSLRHDTGLGLGKNIENLLVREGPQLKAQLSEHRTQKKTQKHILYMFHFTCIEYIMYLEKILHLERVTKPCVHTFSRRNQNFRVRCKRSVEASPANSVSVRRGRRQ